MNPSMRHVTDRRSTGPHSSPLRALYAAWIGLGISASLWVVPAQAESSPEPTKDKGNLNAKPVGTATRAWLEEQRIGLNRAEVEPYPAERAGLAYKRYENAYNQPPDVSGLGSRSGSQTRSTPTIPASNTGAVR